MTFFVAALLLSLIANVALGIALAHVLDRRRPASPKPQAKPLGPATPYQRGQQPTAPTALMPATRGVPMPPPAAAFPMQPALVPHYIQPSPCPDAARRARGEVL